jgi:hypothetical protein
MSFSTVTLAIIALLVTMPLVARRTAVHQAKTPPIAVALASGRLYDIRAMRLRLTAIFLFLILLVRSAAFGAQQGKLKLDVLDELGAGAKPPAQIFAADGSKAGEVTPGQTITLPAGTYKLLLPVVGGNIVREGVQVEPGRVHTVLITNVAVLSVSARNINGKEPGFGVTVTDASPPHQKMAEFLTGDKMLFAPRQVDVKVDVPPQGYLWHAVTLQAGHRAGLEFNEEKQAELMVQTSYLKSPIDRNTRVVIYQGGTQKQAAVSAPGAEHRFTLDPGEYDIYVENLSGKGRPYMMDRSVHLKSGEKVERSEALDGETTAKWQVNGKRKSNGAASGARSGCAPGGARRGRKSAGGLEGVGCWFQNEAFKHRGSLRDSSSRPLSRKCTSGA